MIPCDIRGVMTREHIDKKKLASFAASRRNSDGGYSFSYPLFGVEFPSSISETYYALAVLSMLKEEIPAKSQTIRYLQDAQREDGCYDSPGVAFYAVKSLLLLGEKPRRMEFVGQLRGILREFRIFSEQIGDEFFSADYDTSESPFKLVYCASKTLSLLDIGFVEDVSWLLQFKRDGGFGIKGPDVTATYHALTTLRCGGHSMEKLGDTAIFITGCGTEEGGYSSVPGSVPAFIETTYFAIGALRLLNSKVAGKEKHRKYIVNLQNDDGGFRRSPYLGISTLCNSYYALKALSLLGDHIEKEQGL